MANTLTQARSLFRWSLVLTVTLVFLVSMATAHSANNEGEVKLEELNQLLRDVAEQIRRVLAALEPILHQDGSSSGGGAGGQRGNGGGTEPPPSDASGGIKR